MKKNKFDKNLKDNLQQYISKVDTDALWANIESEVDVVNKNKKKRNYFFFWFIGIGICLFGGSYFLINTDSTPNFAVVKSEILSTPIATTSPVIIEDEDKTLPSNNPLFSDDIEKKTNNIFQKSISKKPLIKKTISNNNSFTKQRIEYFSPSESRKRMDNAIPYISKKEKETSSRKISKTPILASSSLLLKNKPTFPNPLFDKDWNFAATNLKRRTPNSSKKPLQFSFGIQGGVSSTSRGLLGYQTETIDYINIRKETEKTLETLHLGALISLANRSGLELSSGIQWTSIIEKFEFKGSRLETDTIENGLYGYIINPNGDTIPVYDQVINQNEIFYNKKTFNKYRMIGIPILLSYNWGNGNWSLGIEGGIIANISLKTSGQIFNMEGQIIDIQEEQDKVFRSKIGLNYSLGFNARYFITDHLQVTVNPVFRFFPKSFTLPNYPLNQKYYIMGGNIGLRYSF